ncbi:hypothetical protein B7R54_12580 [Subtercola boreus]|uniref:Extensin-like C-terminal domain-containing protein n=2 Tax=Subtercola boreus TaxID=120213 RepID=A0A3E0VJ06_9MICO|nr:hypothetical protein B7R54_12580 [Subtercola boreus]TQL52915.1 hypothetical protein FB464_0404 [Subtercola boreus]
MAHLVPASISPAAVVPVASTPAAAAPTAITSTAVAPSEIVLAPVTPAAHAAAAAPPPRDVARPRSAPRTPATAPALLGRPGRSKPSKKRRVANIAVMTAAFGLIATMALPAYAFSTSGAFTPVSDSAPFGAGQQSIQSSLDQAALSVTRDDYKAPTQDELKAQQLAAAAAAQAASQAAALKLSSGSAIAAAAYPSTVSPAVQALAQQLMDAVGTGQLVGSRPDHIKEIGYLAAGQVVDGCGVDIRVLQTIKVAIDNFSKVGVSDINRLCTGQIEGAGTASPHYRAGGGHAVDFYILNGHSLTGGDSDSMKLLRLLDPLVPPNTNVGQSGCRSSGSGFVNLSEFSDSCSHLHVDFISARGSTLS